MSTRRDQIETEGEKGGGGSPVCIDHNLTPRTIVDMGTNLQDYVDVSSRHHSRLCTADTQLLNAEQHVPVEKIRENARHGVAPSVRGVSIAL